MINISIIGASGYTGLELVKILLNHPEFKINYMANSEGGVKLSELHPSMNSVFEIDINKLNIDNVVKYSDLAFLALPHKTSMAIAKELLARGVKVVDLSADYRLKLETYEKYYTSHMDKDNLKQSVYGLPEFFREDIKNSNLVANPGCYPTASLLALLPFTKYLDESLPIFIDAKSGLSGAGKKCNDLTQFVSVNENIITYNPMNHRHEPEIKEKLSILKEKNFSINFIPQLIPVTRGELVNCYGTIKDEFININPIEILRDIYKDEKFIRIKENAVDIKSTSGTNFCDIFAKVNDKAIFINASIDNLLRGASSQAVVNANIMYGFEENLGIPIISYVP